MVRIEDKKKIPLRIELLIKYITVKNTQTKDTFGRYFVGWGLEGKYVSVDLSLILLVFDG